MKALEWSQPQGHNIIHLFLRCSREANLKVGEGILAIFKLIQALMAVLVTSQNEEVLFQN